MVVYIKNISFERVLIGLAKRRRDIFQALAPQILFLKEADIFKKRHAGAREWVFASQEFKQ
jgi:hypothetical protein